MPSDRELGSRPARRRLLRGRRARRGGAPTLRLGRTRADGISPSMYALLDRGIGIRPGLASSMRGTVLFDFDEGFAPLLVRFGGVEVVVSDEPLEAPDLRVRGSLPAVVHFATAPHMAGIPNPVRAKGLRAIASLAGGRVRIEGEVAFARRLVRLLAL